MIEYLPLDPFLEHRTQNPAPSTIDVMSHIGRLEGDRRLADVGMIASVAAGIFLSIGAVNYHSPPSKGHFSAVKAGQERVQNITTDYRAYHEFSWQVWDATRDSNSLPRNSFRLVDPDIKPARECIDTASEQIGKACPPTNRNGNRG